MRDALLLRGVSEAARFVEETTYKGRQFLHKSSAIGNESVLRGELATIWNVCREANWDGYGAVPVSQDTYRNTRTLLESLPLGFPPPSIGAEPDGDLTLEWHRSARRTLSVSVTADGDLHYAALLGASRVFGTEAFFDEIPDAIEDMIHRVYET